MRAVTAQEIVLSSGIKAWFSGCVAAIVFLLFWDLVLAILNPEGLSVRHLLAGLFLSVVEFTFIAIFTASPAGDRSARGHRWRCASVPCHRRPATRSPYSHESRGPPAEGASCERTWQERRQSALERRRAGPRELPQGRSVEPLQYDAEAPVQSHLAEHL